MTMSRTVWIVGVLVAACGPDDDGSTGSATQPPITTAQLADPGGQDDSAADSSSAVTGTASATDSGATTSPPTTSAGPTTGTSTTQPSDPTGALDDTGTASTAGEVTTDDPPKFDIGQLPDVPPPVCLQCALTIASQQSGTFAVNGPAVFATAQLEGQVVYAIGTHGSGRFIATADSSLPFHEATDCPLTEWLAANGGVQPKVMIVGWGPDDGSPNWEWNVEADIFGIHLPAQYIGNPGLLMDTYDIVMYLEGSGQFDEGDQPSDQEITTLLDYMAMGGGAYISSEFYGYLKDADLVSINRLLQPLGVTTQAVSLNWGNVDGNIDFECFPEPQ